MNKYLASVFAGIMLSAASVGGVYAIAPSNIVTPEIVTSAGPMSFQMFCMINPTECQPGGASKISLTEDALRTMERVNARVNRSIRPKLDSAALQVWKINPGSGDCKSYAVSKRHELMRAGFPSSALRIAYVKTRAGQGHAVLVVKTNQGDLTLDNLTSEIVNFRQAGYRVVAMSGANPKRWS